MSHEHVTRIAEDNLFLPRNRWHELAADHVTLDELEAHAGWEERMRRAICRTTRSPSSAPSAWANRA
jgi:hypothetical protein